MKLSINTTQFQRKSPQVLIRIDHLLLQIDIKMLKITTTSLNSTIDNNKFQNQTMMSTKRRKNNKIIIIINPTIIQNRHQIVGYTFLSQKLMIICHIILLIYMQLVPGNQSMNPVILILPPLQKSSHDINHTNTTLLILKKNHLGRRKCIPHV